MDAIVDEEPGPSGRDPMAPDVVEVVARGIGAVIAACAVAIFTVYVAVPVGTVDGTDVPALIDVSSTFRDIGLILHCLLVAAAGLAYVVRPAQGRGALLATALPLPWLLDVAGTIRDTQEQAGQSTGVLRLVEVLGVVLALAVAAGLLLAFLRLRPGDGVLLTDMVALVVALGGLWATLSLGWYDVVQLRGSTRFGGLLATESWAGRGAWLGLGLAVLALVLAVVDGGPARRAVGLVLAAVLVGEALRRTLLSSDDILGLRGATPFGPIEAKPIVGFIVFQLLGAAAGAWLLTTSGDVDPDAEDGDRTVDPGPPPPGGEASGSDPITTPAGPAGPGAPPDPGGAAPSLPEGPPASPPTSWPEPT
ncbi:MAG TPA: hypothetical protein VEW93_01930 [Acidimicrobiales bacterium]|nr:hypothetical protein [Acidimicrobiales bacterium]